LSDQNILEILNSYHTDNNNETLSVEMDKLGRFPRKFSNRAEETVEESWNFDKCKKKLPDAAAALISIPRVSPKVVRDDECEALGGLEEKAAGSRVADNTQRETLLISMLRTYRVEHRLVTPKKRKRRDVSWTV